MARKIDFANLVEGDHEYLSDRHWMIAEGDAQGFETSKAIQDWRDGVEAAPDEDQTFDPNDMKVADLRAELEIRGLPTEGKKDELIARLVEHDSNDDDDSDDDSDDDIPEED